MHNVGRPIRCVDMNKDGEFIALGLDDGEIIILKTTDNFTQFQQCDSKRQRDALITDIKYEENKKILLIEYCCFCLLDSALKIQFWRSVVKITQLISLNLMEMKVEL